MAFTKVTGPGINSTSNYETNHINSTGIITATSFSGDGSTLTGISAGISLSGSTDNTVCTVTGANAIQGESNVRIDSSGRLLIGHASAIDIGGGTLFQSQITGTNYDTSGFVQTRFEAGGSGPAIVLAHSRHGTKGSHTILQDGDEFGKIRFFGSDGTDFANNGAQIVAKVDGTPGDNDMPGRLEFHTTADGGTSATEKLRITSTGWQQGHAAYAGVGINTFASWARTGGAIRAEVGYNAVTLDYMYFGTGTAHPLALRSNNTTALFIDNNQKIGIGTDNPIRHLHIADYTVDAIPLRIENTGSNTGLELVGGAAKHNYYLGKQKSTDNGFEITPSTAAGNTTFSNPAITVKHDGKVGINDSSPDSILSVKDSYIFSCAGGNATTGMQIGGYDAGANSYNPITVRASQILFNISGTEKARIGSAGITTFTESVNAKSFVPTEQVLGNRNIVINGACSVAQRGTSDTSSAQGYTTVDRFEIGWSGANNIIETHQEQLSSSDTGPWAAGFRNAWKAVNGDQSSGAGTNDYCLLRYYIEAQDMASCGWDYTNPNSFVTISFWLKTSVSGQNFYPYLKTADATDKLFTWDTGNLTQNVWQKFTKSIPGHADIQFDNNNGIGLEFQISLFRGTNWTNNSVSLNQWNTYDNNLRTPDMTSTWWTTNDATFHITGLQLEVGKYATPFEHRSFGDELQRCKRYCYVMKGNQNDMTGASGWCGGSDGAFPYTLPVRMRAAPTFTASGTWRLNSPGGNGSDQTSDLIWSFENTTFDAGRLYLSNISTASSAGDAAFLQFRGTGTTFEWDAEL